MARANRHDDRKAAATRPALHHDRYLRELKAAVIADFAANRAWRRVMEGQRIALLVGALGAATVMPIILDVHLLQDVFARGVGSPDGLLRLLASGVLNAATVFVLRLSKGLGDGIRDFLDADAHVTRQISRIRACGSVGAIHRVLADGGSGLVTVRSDAPPRPQGRDGG